MTSENTNTGKLNMEGWLDALRSDPSPVFTEHLRARLRGLGDGDGPAATSRQSAWRRAVLATAAVAVVGLLISVPGVRASVTQFISLFRVVNVVAVRVDSNRLARLQSEHLDIGALLGEHVQVVQDPGPPLPVLSLADASAAAGMTVAVPQWLPENSRVLETTVMGERVVRVTADSVRLQQVMDALGINDLTVPAGLDGYVVNVRVPPVVMIRYDHGKLRSRLYQARSPQLTLPNNIDVQTLGEIGLRILGLAPAEAKQFAHAIDWHTTLIVPVPPNVSSLRQVNIEGHPGVLIQHQAPNESPTSTIIWSTPERVFALVTIEGVDEALAMATSVR